MTRRFTSSKANFLPVIFRVFDVYKQGVNKGKPVIASFTTIQLDRCVYPELPGEKYESVATTIARLREMLKESNKRFSIVACEESADERKARRVRDNVELVSETTVVEEPKVELSASMQLRVKESETLPITPITKGSRTLGVDDESLGVRVDNGRHATVKRAVAKKKAA